MFIKKVNLLSRHIRVAIRNYSLERVEQIVGKETVDKIVSSIHSSKPIVSSSYFFYNFFNSLMIDKM